MKKIILLIAAIIVIGLLGVTLYSVGKNMQTTPPNASTSTTASLSPTPGGKLNGNPTNFAYEGKITFVKQGARVDAPVFTYLQNGAVSTSTTLLFDELSACAASNGSEPCMAFDVPLDVPFNNKNALIEGIHIQGGVLVRKLQIETPGDHLHKPPTGRVFISWPQALDFIKSCGPTLVTQTHDLDVSLHMPDATVLVAVEPVIDEVMRAIQASQPTCKAIPVATE